MSSAPRLESLLSQQPASPAEAAEIVRQLVESAVAGEIEEKLAERVRAKLTEFAVLLDAPGREAAARKAEEGRLNGVAALLRGCAVDAASVFQQSSGDERVRALFEIERPDPKLLSEQSLPAGRKSAERLLELVSRVESFRERARSGALERNSWRSDGFHMVFEGYEHFQRQAPFLLTSLDFENGHAGRLAIEQMQPVRDLRLRVGSVRCQFSATPVFAARSGKFDGYRGHLSSQQQEGFLGFSGDRLAELAHEVLTPLNAIMGYAQMIEQEILGPAPESLKGSATQLLSEAGSLMTAVDALGDLASLDRKHLVTGAAEIVLSEPLLRSVEGELAAPARSRGVTLAVEVDAGAAMVCSQEAIHRALVRVGMAILSYAEAGEKVCLSASEQTVAMTMPRALRRRSLGSLLSAPPLKSSQESTPLLGLAFALRLARKLMEGQGGALDVTNDRLSFRCDVPRGCESALAS